VSNDKGLKYDEGKPPIDLVPSQAIIAIAKVLGFGAKKYSAHNWRKGIVFSRLLSAAMRHLLAYNAGESLDPESGLNHIAHAACCLSFLLTFEAEGRKDLDDRFDKSQVNDIKNLTNSGIKIDAFVNFAGHSYEQQNTTYYCSCGNPNCKGSGAV